jgi:hypothetical protein
LALRKWRPALQTGYQFTTTYKKKKKKKTEQGRPLFAWVPLTIIYPNLIPYRQQLHVGLLLPFISHNDPYYPPFGLPGK